jgi:hypothetical protein
MPLVYPSGRSDTRPTLVLGFKPAKGMAIARSALSWAKYKR